MNCFDANQLEVRYNEGRTGTVHPTAVRLQAAAAAQHNCWPPRLGWFPVATPWRRLIEGNKMTKISRLNFNGWNRFGERLQSGKPIGWRLIHSLSPVYYGVNLDVLKTCNL